MNSVGGHRFFVIFKDDHSSFWFEFFMKHKSEVFDYFLKLARYTENVTGNKVIRLRSDNAKEYLSRSFQTHLDAQGICHDLTAPYTPEQNSVAERDNRTIVECAQRMLHHRCVPLRFWAEAVNTAVYILNRLAVKGRLEGRTPTGYWSGETPDVSHFRTFGSLAWSPRGPVIWISGSVASNDVLLLLQPKQNTFLLRPAAKKSPGFDVFLKILVYYLLDLDQCFATTKLLFALSEIQNTTSARSTLIFAITVFVSIRNERLLTFRIFLPINKLLIFSPRLYHQRSFKLFAILFTL